MQTTDLKISFSTNGRAIDKGVVIFLVAQDKVLSPKLAKLNKNELVEKALEVDHTFDGKQGSCAIINAQQSVDSELIFVFSIGQYGLTNLRAQELGADICAKLNSMKISKATLYVEDNIAKDSNLDLDHIISNIALGIKMEQYSFIKYYSKKLDQHKKSLVSFDIISEKAEGANKLFTDEFQPLVQGMYFTRDLVSEPPNELYPISFAERCLELQKSGVKVTILEKNEIKKLGMNALLGVAQGSVNEPRVVIMEWNGKGDEKDDSRPIAFAGKGVTFDSGGINLKPTNGIADMKYDMAGAGVVAGLMKALSGRKSKVHVVGIVGLVENMPSGSAQRPSDVVVSMSKQTIEVDNTDAEGRLVLADILWYVQEKYNPSCVIDLATLTGAIVVALGEGAYAGLFSNDDKLADKLRQAGEKCGETVWRMPMGDYYDKQIDSEIADVRNTGSGYGGGSITAAQFLARFIMNDVSWAHLDIAGMAWTKKGRKLYPKGATGFGVKLLNEFLQSYYECDTKKCDESKEGKCN